MTLMTKAPVALRLPDFLIIGEMRCGSTTLWELLSRDERVFFPVEKEVHFFDGRNGNWDRGVKAYADLFAGAAPEQRCGEATPDYLFHDDACRRIHEIVPDARLLVILRDPIARAWSHYWHNVRRGREMLTFDQALDAEPSRLAAGDADQRSHCSYIARGRYIDQLHRYESLFRRDQICVTFLEHLKADPISEMSRVCRHLDLEGVEAMGGAVVPERNKAKYPRWPRLNAAAGATRKWVETRAPLLAAPARWAATVTRPLRVYSGQARMTEAQHARLEAAYKESNAALAAWLGRKLPWAKG